MVDFASECMDAARPGVEAVIPAHWKEFGDSDLPCQPNWKLYKQFDQHNALVVVTARDEGVLVGYMIAIVYPHVSAGGSMVAEIPTYFVVERPVRALVLSRMQDFMLQELVTRGVYKVDIWTKAERSAGRLWEGKGFAVSKIGYTLKLKRGAQDA